MASAEDIYLFRHAVYREVAYQLQVPSARSVLHMQVIAILERAFAGRLAAVCHELAQHARHAQDGALAAELPRLQQLKVQHLALLLATRRHTQDLRATSDAARRVLDLPAFWPEVRLAALLDYADSLRGFAPHQDVVMAFEAVCVAAEQQGNLKVLSDALLQRANLALHVGDTDAAGEFYDQADRAAEQLGNPVAIGWAKAARSNLHDFHEDHATAEKLLRQAYAQVEGGGGRQLALAIRGNLANLLGQVGRRAEAIAEYRSILHGFEALGNAAGAATARSNLGRQFLLEGELERAEEAIRHARAFHLRAGIRVSQAFSATNLAEVCVLTGRFEEAESLLDEANEAARETGIHQRIAAVLAARAGFELLCGHENAAQELVEQSRAEFEAARATMFVPEYCDIVRLRIAASMTTTAVAPRGTSTLKAAPPQRKWLPVMRQLLAGMEAALARQRRPHGTMIETATLAGRALLAEIEAAVAQSRPALVYRGWLANELRPAQRKALLARLEVRSPSQAAMLKRHHPALWQAMNA